MTGRRLAGLASVLLLAVVACQGQPLPPLPAPVSGEHVVTVSPNQGGTIRLAINAPAAMRTQAAAKVYADIDHLTVKLKRKVDDSLAADAGNVAKNGTTTHVVFNNVTTGSVYYLEIDAFDINGFSIAKTSPTKSGDIDVNAATTFNVPVTFPLKDGTGVVLNFSFTAPTYFPGAVRYLLWLKNNLNGTTTTTYKSTTATPALSGLADGNYTAWAAAVDDANGLMTPVKQVGTVTVAGGALTAPVGGTFNVSFGNAVSQWATNGAWSLVGMGVDAAGAAYGLDSVGAQVLKVASAGAGTTNVVGNGTPGNAVGDGSESALGSVITENGANPAGLYLDGDGNIFVGDTNGLNLKLRMVPFATIPAGRYGVAALTAGQIYTIGTSAIGPRGIGMDSGQTIYWTDNQTVKRMKPDGNTSTMAVLPSPAVLNGLAVDRSGNLFAAQRTKVFHFVATPGTYFGVDQTAAAGTWVELTALATATPNAYRHVAVDPVGNLYVADSPNQTIWGLDALTGTKYKVIGQGASGTVLSDGGAPNSGTVLGANGLAVGTTGGLYFTTTTAMWRFP